MGIDTELDAARLQLLEDRATESHRQHIGLLIYLVFAVAIAVGLGVYFARDVNIPAVLAVAAFALAAGQGIALVIAMRGNEYLAAVLSQVLPILPMVLFASALSADAGFGSYLFIGALGVMVTIPEGHNTTRYVCFAALVVGVAITQIFFLRAHSWSPVGYDQTTAINTFNRTIMSIALFVLALEVTRANRVSRKLVNESLRIADLVATLDPLTGVPNRRPAWARLDEAALAGRPVTVALADMDHFKHLNDTAGHDCGDDALRHVAGVLRDSVRAGDLVARWGGEEFLIVLDLPLEQAVAICDRARAQVAASPVPCERGEPHRISLSMGAASMINADPAAAVAAADSALYQAKESGRDRVVAST